MTSFQDAFVIFDATDVIGFAAQMNVWGGNLETAVSELRGAILMQGAELEAMRNGFALIEQRTEQVTQFGGKAVAELDAIMTAFRAEIVMNKSERVAEGEALKGELRQLVEHLQAKFLEVGGAIRTLTATAASAAATVPSRQDPWFRPGQPAPQDASGSRNVSFRMDVDSDESFAGPPGVSAGMGQPSRSRVATQEFRVDLRNWKRAPLDLAAKPDSFLAWHDRALGLLSGNRLDVRRFLLWAEQRDTPIDAAAEQDGARAAGLVHDEVATVSFNLF